MTITLREPSPTFLYGITLTPFGIVSPAILESTGADSSETSTFDTDIVQAGTGPFILEDYIPDDSAVLVRNDRLLGRAPGLPGSADHSADRGPGGAPPGAPGRQHPGL